jgi:putative membrane protein
MIAKIVVLLIALLHLYIMVIEMWYWDKPRGLKSFGIKQEFATSTKVMAANQGLYNGFLAGGLIWGLLHQNHNFGLQIQVFFLICIFIAGLYGAYTSSKKILFIQSVPALIGVLLAALNYFNV